MRCRNEGLIIHSIGRIGTLSLVLQRRFRAVGFSCADSRRVVVAPLL